MTAPLLQVDNLTTQFGGKRRFLAPPQPLVRAVDDVSFTLSEGGILGLVGESGCGKSTLAKTLLGTLRETSGQIRLDGKHVSELAPVDARKARSDIQYVHQDPGAALDPWWRIGDTLHETLIINGEASAVERAKRIDAMLEAVGLNGTFLNRYPHELSGGQQRRVGLARILVLKPRLVILDEPTSGLDLSVQATVLKLIRDLHREFKLTYIFISHDLSVVERMCDRVLVMYLGRVAEHGASTTIFKTPGHPYTQALLKAAPRLVPGQLQDQDILAGDPPSPSAIPSGCAFRNRCPRSEPVCSEKRPAPDALQDKSHLVACLRPWENQIVSNAS